MTALVAAIVAAGIVLPHALRLHRVAPATAATLWISSLVLRALTGAFVVLYMIRFAPHTEIFSALTHWCWHAVIPLLGLRDGLEGRRVGDAATILPAFVLVASGLWVTVGVARTARSVRRLLARGSLGTGPEDSVIVGGPDVMLATAGLRRPRVLVSAGALTALDDDELAAGIDHERGHIARWHRYLVLLANVCGAVGRLVPGGRRAFRELAFHLERDADRWALARRNDRYALASAICKAATAARFGGPATAPLAGPGVGERLGQLLDDDEPPVPRLAGAALNAVATVIVAVTVALTVLVPAAALAGVDPHHEATHDHHGHHCHHVHR